MCKTPDQSLHHFAHAMIVQIVTWLEYLIQNKTKSDVHMSP